MAIAILAMLKKIPINRLIDSNGTDTTFIECIPVNVTYDYTRQYSYLITFVVNIFKRIQLIVTYFTPAEIFQPSTQLNANTM